MHDLTPSHISQAQKHLTYNKFKATMVRKSMILNRVSQKDEQMAKKVFKFESFLSHQMLDKLKTQEIKLFQKQMKEYCQRQRSMQSTKIKSESQVGIEQYLNSIRKKYKVGLQRDKKKSSPSEQDSQIIIFSPKCSFSQKQKQLSLERQQSTLKYNKPIQLKREKKITNKRLKLKGIVIKSSLIQLMEKPDYLQNRLSSDHLPIFNPIIRNAQDQMLPTDKLKLERQRLNTVLQNHRKIQFQPIGKLGKGLRAKRYHHNSQKKTCTQIPSIRKQSCNQSSNKKTYHTSSKEILDAQNNIKISSVIKTSESSHSSPNIKHTFNSRLK